MKGDQRKILFIPLGAITWANKCVSRNEKMAVTSISYSAHSEAYFSRNLSSKREARGTVLAETSFNSTNGEEV